MAQSNREISGHPIESISLTADRSQHYMQRELMTGASPGPGLAGSVEQPPSIEQQPQQQQQQPPQLPASSRDYSHFGGDVSHLAAQQSSPFDRRTTPPGQQGDSGSSSTNTAWQGQRSSQVIALSPLQAWRLHGVSIGARLGCDWRVEDYLPRKVVAGLICLHQMLQFC